MEAALSGSLSNCSLPGCCLEGLLLGMVKTLPANLASVGAELGPDALCWKGYRTPCLWECNPVQDDRSDLTLGMQPRLG